MKEPEVEGLWVWMEAAAQEDPLNHHGFHTVSGRSRPFLWPGPVYIQLCFVCGTRLLPIEHMVLLVPEYKHGHLEQEQERLPLLQEPTAE